MKHILTLSLAFVNFRLVEWTTYRRHLMNRAAVQPQNALAVLYELRTILMASILLWWGRVWWSKQSWSQLLLKQTCDRRGCSFSETLMSIHHRVDSSRRLLSLFRRYCCCGPSEVCSFATNFHVCGGQHISMLRCPICSYTVVHTSFPAAHDYGGLCTSKREWHEGIVIPKLDSIQ